VVTRDLARRRAARASLIAFTRYTFPEYRPAGHHLLIAEKLEAVAKGEIKRLLIFMPPRHGKSELASKRFPAWFVGANPRRNIIAASYNSDLATDFGREVRNIVGTSRYRAVFDTSLSGDSTAANRWHTDQGGMYVAAGIGTAVTGRGPHVFLIDDPFKDREEADSERQREKVWRWYTSTAYTRLESDVVGDVTGDDELEQGQIVKSIGPFLDKRMREARVYCRREQVTSAADKPTRSRSIQARAAMGKVYLPSKAPWLSDFLSELLMFPAGKHDDIVDSFGLIGRMLDDMVPAARPKQQRTPLRDGYVRAGEDSMSWRV
jgi:hypothetical protein